MKKSIWNSMLDADMNVRYFRYLTLRYQNKEKYAKIFLAIMASGVVASWGFWIEYELVWKVLSGISAVIAIILPIVNWPASIKSFSELKRKWEFILYDYDHLWARRNSIPSMELDSKFSEIKNRERQVSNMEVGVPNNKKLLKECQREVNKARGL